MIGVYEHVRKVNDKMAIRNCVRNTNELAIEPRRCQLWELRARHN